MVKTKSEHMMQAYDTVTEASNDLSKRGYTSQFKLLQDCLLCEEEQIRLQPEDFKIDEVYRFEGNTNPDNEMIVYAVSSTRGDIKGTLVNAYGMYSDTASEESMSKLKIHPGN